MRITIWLLLLSVSLGYAQDVAYVDHGSRVNYRTLRSTPTDKQLLKAEDFKSENGRMIVNSLPVQIPNQNVTNTIVVSVVCQQQAFNTIGVAKINEMILAANEKVRKSVPEGFLYNPKEFRMAYNPESQDWSLTNLYTSEDFTGAVKTGMLNIDFDSAGKFEAMKRVM